MKVPPNRNSPKRFVVGSPDKGHPTAQILSLLILTDSYSYLRSYGIEKSKRSTQRRPHMFVRCYCSRYNLPSPVHTISGTLAQLKQKSEKKAC